VGGLKTYKKKHGGGRPGVRVEPMETFKGTHRDLLLTPMLGSRREEIGGLRGGRRSSARGERNIRTIPNRRKPTRKRELR